MGPLIPLFWTFGDISSGFQSQSGQPYSHLAEAYTIYVPCVSPLVRHLPTSWRPTWQSIASPHACCTELFPWMNIIFTYNLYYSFWIHLFMAVSRLKISFQFFVTIANGTNFKRTSLSQNYLRYIYLFINGCSFLCCVQNLRGRSTWDTHLGSAIASRCQLQVQLLLPKTITNFTP